MPSRRHYLDEAVRQYESGHDLRGIFNAVMALSAADLDVIQKQRPDTTFDNGPEKYRQDVSEEGIVYAKGSAKVYEPRGFIDMALGDVPDDDNPWLDERDRYATYREAIRKEAFEEYSANVDKRPFDVIPVYDEDFSVAFSKSTPVGTKALVLVDDKQYLLSYLGPQHITCVVV